MPAWRACILAMVLQLRCVSNCISRDVRGVSRGRRRNTCFVNSGVRLLAAVIAYKFFNVARSCVSYFSKILCLKKCYIKKRIIIVKQILYFVKKENSINFICRAFYSYRYLCHVFTIANNKILKTL